MVILFDLDGPILDVSGRYYRLYSDLIARFGGRALGLEQYWELKRQRVCETDILRRSGLTGQETDFTALRRSLIEKRQYLNRDRVWPQAEAALRRLQGTARLLLVTMRHDRTALDWQLDRLGLRPLFSAVLATPSVPGAADQGLAKASLVREALGPGPFEGWFIGDTGTDILAGRELGVRTAAVAFGIRGAEELVPLAPDRLLAAPEDLDDWSSMILAGKGKG